MRARLAIAVAGVLMGASQPARAADAPPPADQDFLEYLGSWDGDDADWQVVAAEPPPAPPAHRKLPTTPERKQAQGVTTGGTGAQQEQHR